MCIVIEIILAVKICYVFELLFSEIIVCVIIRRKSLVSQTH